ncbi:NUDIX domain-containing protein [Limosilactobacillus sp.]|uniref:NUDIX hydrolase n=1 Tax=Limosilactobacillus sp. TaxID=2773925 RepID=UPI00345EB89F
MSEGVLSLERITERPLITITNIIWSFNRQDRHPQILLIKRADDPFRGVWALPETLLRKSEDADSACVRLIKEKIGLTLPASSTEQLATFTAPDRTPGERFLALAYMTFLPTMPHLNPGYGATEAQWFSLNYQGSDYYLQHDQICLKLARGTRSLAFDHTAIITTALRRIRNKLDYQPNILKILGPTFTLRQAREVYASFWQKKVDQIDNSNFQKTHRRLFSEAGVVDKPKHSGRPPKLYKLRN